MTKERKATLKAKGGALAARKWEEPEENWEDHLPPGIALGGEIGIIGAFWDTALLKNKK